MKLFKRSETAIGIDIGSRTIKAAQLRLTDAGPEIMGLAMIPRQQTGASVTHEDIVHLRRVLHRQGFVGRRLALAVPDEQLLRGHLDLPAGVSGSPVAQMARMELARIHQVEPQTFEMIHWGLPGGDKSLNPGQIVALACPHEAADQLLDTVEGCGLEVWALDVRTAAAARACTALTLPAPALTAILDLGWSSTKLMLVSGGTVIYERLLKSDLGSLTRSLIQRFTLTDTAACQIIDTVGLQPEQDTGDLDEDSLKVIHRILSGHFCGLAEELQTPFSYAAHQYMQEGIQRLLLVGGGACIPGLADHLAEVLRMEVHRAAPIDLMTSTAGTLTKADNPAATVAVGLSLFTESAV